jgi:hypothetical protein
MKEKYEKDEDAHHVERIHDKLSNKWSLAGLQELKLMPL